MNMKWAATCASFFKRRESSFEKRVEEEVEKRLNLVINLALLKMQLDGEKTNGNNNENDSIGTN